MFALRRGAVRLWIRDGFEWNGLALSNSYDPLAGSQCMAEVKRLDFGIEAETFA